jgi:hypothetical protein
MYSDRVPESLSNFINDLGRQWSVHLDSILGKANWRLETADGSFLPQVRAIGRIGSTSICGPQLIKPLVNDGHTGPDSQNHSTIGSNE